MSRYRVEGAVSNYTDAETVEIRAVIFEAGEVAAEERRMVLLKQSAASLSFQFGMTPTQARELAALLVQGADSLESTS